MSDNVLTEKILKKIDFTDLVYEMSQLAVAALTGQEIEKEIVKVDLEIPKSILSIIKKVADAAGTDIQESLSALANQGLNNILSQQVKKVKPENPEPVDTDLDDLAGKMGFDMSNINEQFSKLGNLANQLEGLSKVFNNADFNQTQNTKNNK